MNNENSQLMALINFSYDQVKKDGFYAIMFQPNQFSMSCHTLYDRRSGVTLDFIPFHFTQGKKMRIDCLHTLARDHNYWSLDFDHFGPDFLEAYLIGSRKPDSSEQTGARWFYIEELAGPQFDQIRYEIVKLNEIQRQYVEQKKSVLRAGSCIGDLVRAISPKLLRE